MPEKIFTRNQFVVKFIRYTAEDSDVIEISKDKFFVQGFENLSKNEQMLYLFQFLAELENVIYVNQFVVVDLGRVASVSKLDFKSVNWLDDSIEIDVTFNLTNFVQKQAFIDAVQRLFYDKGWMPGNFNVVGD